MCPPTVRLPGSRSFAYCRPVRSPTVRPPGSRSFAYDGRGGELRVHFDERDRPAAVFEVAERTEGEIVWRCVDGPEDWRETRIAFVLKPRDGGGTTLLFSHGGWREENEFMHGCSTNWAAYLMSLKAGAEGRPFAPYPAGEISRWD